jgi:hypothetical protein
MRCLIACVLALFLAACSARAPVGQPTGAGAKRAPADLVAAVRATGADGTELDVQPLPDPQVQDLVAKAQALEAQGKFKPAMAALSQALAITPGAPDLLQFQAELSLYLKAWLQAEQLAGQSFERGPRMGGLCRRNWTTVQLAREQRKDAAGAEVARRQLATCTPAPPVRL